MTLPRIYKYFPTCETHLIEAKSTWNKNPIVLNERETFNVFGNQKMI